MRATRDLEWPADPDLYRDIAQAQTIADGSLLSDPFYRGEAVRNSQIPGVGLGLSLVKRIVEAHHGAIEVKSSTGSGAAFILYLPAQPVPVAAEAEMKEVAS